MTDRLRISACTVAALAITFSTEAAVMGVETHDLDRKVDACTDFYGFANGTWRKENSIPSHLSKWSRRIASHDDNWHRQKRLLDAIVGKSDWSVSSAEQVAGDYYASCMDMPTVAAAGISPLLPVLVDLNNAHTLTDVERNIRRFHDVDIPVGFSTHSAPGSHDPLHGEETISVAALGLPDRDYYLSDESRFADARKEYKEHIAALLNLAGLSNSEARIGASDILALETHIASAALGVDEAANPSATDHVLTFSQLVALAPHFDWETYFNDAHLPKIAVNVAQPRVLEQFDRLLLEVPVATWNIYMKWQLVESAAPSLSSRFVDEFFRFHDEYFGHATHMKPIAQRCVESTDALFGDALAQLYVKAYFPPAAKAKAQEIVRNLRTALREQIDAIQWLSPRTKQVALEKLAATDVQVGYPDHWNNYAGVQVRRDTLWANVMTGRRYNVQLDRATVGRATPRDFWLPTPTPSSADGYLLVELNKIVLPAGHLQPPFFNVDATDAVNYGAMGITVAHDLTHFIDSLGAANDLDGWPVNWWTDKDRKNLAQRSQCLVDQYNGYFVEPGYHHDGERVLMESTADLAGAHIAYVALHHAMKSHRVPVVDGFTPDQQFFISWGQAAGAAMSTMAQRALISGDPHPTPQYRVIGPLSNMAEFQRAFSCKATAEMVRPLLRRCNVW